MFDRFSNWLIARAKRTPYFDLAGYMERNWLVPYSFIPDGYSATDPAKSLFATGCGPVSFFKRPIAWVLQQFDVAIRVHRFLRGDDDRAFHDHPWSYLSVILKGGYFEVTPTYDASGLYTGATRKWHGPGSILFRRAKHWHRIELAEPTDILEDPELPVTLFVTFKKQQAWGFMPQPSTKIYWKDYT